MIITVGSGHTLHFPLPRGWKVTLVEAANNVVLRDDTWTITFTYDFYEPVVNSSGVFLKGDVLVQKKGYGRRWTPARVLYQLAVGNFR